MAAYQTYVDSNVRLIILRALEQQLNASLNDAIIQAELERFGHVKSRDYIRNQLTWLANEVGAVRLTPAGTAVVASLTQAGLDHVERRSVLEGVQRPGLEG